MRTLWRRGTPLPPWAEHLSGAERRLEARLEKLLAGPAVRRARHRLSCWCRPGEHWVPVHVAAQIAFLATIAAHVGLVLRHTVVHRNRHLARML